MTALFTSTSLGEELSVMFSTVIEVSVDAYDGFPMYACQNCMSSAKLVHDKLTRLRSMAKSNYREATCTGIIDVHGL